MAAVVVNNDGTATITLTQVEQDTLSGLPAGQLENYVTLWLQERATQMFQARFAALSPPEQAEVLTKFRQAKPAQPVPKP